MSTYMRKQNKSNWFWQFVKMVASPLGLIVVIALAVKQVPGVVEFLTWTYNHMGENGQITVFVIGWFGLIYFAVFSMKREERICDLKAERDVLEEQLSAKEAELKQVEEHNFRLAEEGVKEDIWRRDVIGVPPFVDKSERNARFISLLNLKEGWVKRR